MTTTTAPAPTSRKRTYPAATMLRARALSEAGWYPTDIRRILTSEGLGTPSIVTIQLWTNGRYAASHAARLRQRGAERTTEKTRFRLPGSSPVYQAAFVDILTDAGVSADAIEKVCAIVFHGAPVPPEGAGRRGRPSSRRDWGARREARLLALGLSLRERDLSYGAISVIFELYEAADMTADGLRRWLTENGATRNPNKARLMQERQADRAAA